MIMKVIFFMLVVVTLTNGLSPILIVPGYTGSQLEAKISDGSDCDTHGEWVTMWVDISQKVECINKVLTLVYDEKTGTYSNSSGVEVRVPGFGDTKTVEFLDKKEDSYTEYFHTFVEYFKTKGYKPGENIRAAPYDWRLAADGLKKIGYYDSLKKLIEDMHSKNGGKVSIVVHSMGGPVTLFFLNNIVPQDWKDKYINAFIPLSGAWSGAGGALLTFISAIRYGSSNYEMQFGISFQTMESTAWLLPDPRVWKDKVILTTSTKQYSAEDYESFFDSINKTTEYTKIKKSVLAMNYTAPNVPVHCLYGVDVQTVETVHYGSKIPKTYANISYGNGDDAVNLISSQFCQQWSSQKAPFTYKTFSGTHHGQMVSTKDVLDAVAEAVMHP